LSRDAARHRPKTILQLLKQTEEYLERRGSQTPRLDAQVLLAHVLGIERIQLYVEYDRALAEPEIDTFRELVRRRATHEPVAYLVAHKEFWSHPFLVDKRALIPRPDTETVLIEIEHLYTQVPPDWIADIGTGSGCLACALLRMFPQGQAIATDQQTEALALAEENARALGVRERMELRCGDLLDPLLPRRVDLICANLPYIPTQQLNDLPDSVRRFEPLQALDGGPDGLTHIRRLVELSPQGLNPGAWLVLEVGADQSAEVCGLFNQAGFADVHTRRDLAGVERVVAGRLSPAPPTP
jgi:release factor glutamine methyltransferase